MFVLLREATGSSGNTHTYRNIYIKVSWSMPWNILSLRQFSALQYVTLYELQLNYISSVGPACVSEELYYSVYPIKQQIRDTFSVLIN